MIFFGTHQTSVQQANTQQPVIFLTLLKDKNNLTRLQNNSAPSQAKQIKTAPAKIAPSANHTEEQVGDIRQPESSTEPVADFDITKAKQIARDIAGKLGNKSALQVSKDTLSAKLASGLSKAYIGSSDDGTTFYTSEDGIRYTRIIFRGRAKCFISNSKNELLGILHNLADPIQVNCPSNNISWSYSSN